MPGRIQRLIGSVTNLHFLSMIYPTNTFPTLEPQNRSIEELYELRKRQSPDFKTLKLWKGLSGT